MSVRGQSEIHIKLMQDLCNNLVVDDFNKLKDHCKAKEYGGFGAGQLEKILSLSDLFSKLQQKRIFKEGDYNKLKKLLLRIDNEESVEIVKEAEGALYLAGIPVEGYLPVGAAPPYYGFEQRPHPYNQMPPQPPFGPRYHVDIKHSSDAMPSMSSFSHGPTSVIPPHSGGQFGHVPNMNNMYPSGQSQPGMMSHSSGQYGHGPNGNSMYPSGQSQPGITVDANHNTTMGQDEKYYTPGRGYILFINNYFRGPPPHGCEQYEPRKGAEIDRASVENLRTSLHNYEIQIEEELGQTEFWNSLKKAHTEVGGGNYSCFILIISSHGIETEITKDGQTGKKESIVLVDSSQVTVDAIRDYFDGWSAPKLVGKPKVFVIQACRGIKSARGILDRSDCNPPAQVIPTPPTQLSRPENADVLIAYSTSPGTRSWRNEQEGTWYINCLCKAIAHNKGPGKEHFLDLLVQVHNQIAKRETQGNDVAVKQMPCLVTSFTKKFLL
ncbi:uncharacterized protein [Apostichopus japonicus]|uniref:Caspase-3 n=1 Tax=Stichopus japonicus TaxID=307972 RepID=A0A1C9UNC2_STIJA|nr:caspase-3 [Apostichopus japonicus]